MLIGVPRALCGAKVRVIKGNEDKQKKVEKYINK